MKKLNPVTLISIIVLGATLSSGESFGKSKHYIVKLKGNVLYAAGHKIKKTGHKAAIQQEAVVANVQTQEPAEQLSTAQKVVLENNQMPVNTAVAVSNVNFEDRQGDIHNKIYQMFPGTYLDSMNIVIQLLSDSIRGELSREASPDIIRNLKICLANCLGDSLTIDRLSRLSTVDNQDILASSGVLTVHCKDASSTTAIDSVVMDVFSGSHLIASGMSDKNGAIKASGIPEGDYYVVFSRRAYEPFSLMKVNVSTVGQSYLDIPLSPRGGYVNQMLGKNAWMFITTGAILLLFIMVVLAFYLAKYNARRISIRTHTNAKFI